MTETNGLLERVAAPVFRAALLISLAAAGWAVFRQLPEDPAGLLGDEGRGETTALRIVLRRPADYPREENEKTTVKLYPVSVEAAHREYESERRPGVRFEEFLTRRMGGREPITAELDERDEALLNVPQGRWWIHVDLEGPYELPWRLPVNVSGHDKTVELNFDNRYTRTKSF